MGHQTLPLEKKMAQCALDCYQSGDYESIHRCVNNCQQSLQQVAKRIQGELNGMQSSVQACQQSVVKRLEPRMQGASSDPEAQKAITREYEQSVIRCVKEAEPTLPDIERRIMGY